MLLEERLTLYQAQYEELLRLGKEMLSENDLTDQQLELFWLKRERCILLMQQQPLLTIEKLQLKELLTEAKLDEKEKQLAAQYKALLAINRQVTSQDQAILMKLRGLAKKEEGAGTVMKQRKKIETYAQKLERTGNNDMVGQRYDRLR